MKANSYKKARRRVGFAGTFSLALLLFFASSAAAEVKSVDLLVDLPARAWKAARLKNLPKMSALKITVAGEGEATVYLVDRKNYEIFPDIERSVFKGEVRGELTFTVRIPVTGNYFLVLQNSSTVKRARMDINIRAAAVSEAHLLNRRTGKDTNQDLINKTLSRISAGFNKILIFKPFPVNAEKCGRERAFSGADGVVLCEEFAWKVYGALDDKEKTSHVLLFAILHEMAHLVLMQWQYPFYDNEDIADEFATMLFIMTNQRKYLSDVMEYFLSNSASTELMIKVIKGDRHQLSFQRARNIQVWARDTGRLKKWMRLLIPHMQTPVLKKLLETKPSLVDSNMIKRELAGREE